MVVFFKITRRLRTPDTILNSAFFLVRPQTKISETLRSGKGKGKDRAASTATNVQHLERKTKVISNERLRRFRNLPLR